MIIKALRKNIGTVIAILGFFLLCVVTFGDLGEFMTEAYWQNVKQNLISIGFLTVALSLIQVSIKQGLAEQALQSGLNTDNTTKKYEEHKTLITKNQTRTVYLPYFLQIYNKRHTIFRKREFLVDNNYLTEEALLASHKRKLIKKYKNIKVLITSGRIKWATTDITYNKYGQIQTLQEHRANRIANSLIMSFAFMLGVTLLSRGLFFDAAETPLWQKFVKLATYIISITIGSIFSVIKEYEKGAFGVPNDLDEINEIWNEFTRWEVPEWVKAEIESINSEKEAKDEKRENSIDGRTVIQEEQKEGEIVPNIEPRRLVLVADTNGDIFRADDKELSR